MKRQHLSQTELMVMLAILRLGREAYGIPIADEINKRTGRELTMGVVYSTLGRLEEDALVRSETGEATAARGGRAKTYFELTAKGLKQVRETQRSLQSLWNGIPQLRSDPA
jgi:DNA-binding PadR family transcriptional regulator